MTGASGRSGTPSPPPSRGGPAGARPSPSVLIARLVEAGRLDHDTRVSELRSGFGARGKGGITVGDALAHRAGVSALRHPVSLDEALDRRTMAGPLAGQEPLWEPGSGYAYQR
ncbi:serine hydrolase [Arthrobacter sp. TMS1-12-1]